MEISLIVVLWVIFSVIQVIAERRKVPPAPTELPPDFEIPTLANDPTRPVEEVNLAEIYQRRRAEKIPQPVQQPVQKSQPPQKSFDVELTPATAMNAIILAEILDKPKALRRR